ncbi:hypothetical protein [Petralouisia muris]|jgi:hypothetical protein|nr:hypothetical protein [Petralouisia muris]
MKNSDPKEMCVLLKTIGGDGKNIFSLKISQDNEKFNKVKKAP